jgi:hypothetical protein
LVRSTGTIAVTEQNDAPTAAGLVRSTGTIAVTEQDDPGSGSGEVFDGPNNGTIAVTEGDDTASATGTVSGEGTAPEPVRRRGGGNVNNPYPPFQPRKFNHAPLSGSAEQEQDAYGEIFIDVGVAAEVVQETRAAGVIRVEVRMRAAAEQYSVSVYSPKVLEGHAMAEQRASGDCVLVPSNEDELLALLLLV